MAKFSGVRCDQCGKVEDLTAELVPPPGWYNVGQFPRGEDIYVCRTACGKKWFTEREKAEKNPGKKGDDRVDGYCLTHCTFSEEQQETLHDSNCAKGKLYARS